MRNAGISYMGVDKVFHITVYVHAGGHGVGQACPNCGSPDVVTLHIPLCPITVLASINMKNVTGHAGKCGFLTAGEPQVGHACCRVIQQLLRIVEEPDHFRNRWSTFCPHALPCVWLLSIGQTNIFVLSAE